MKIAAFLQLRNEHQNGNLIRCLSNCRQWSDEIWIYDDASDDGSQDIYLDYTTRDRIIFGTKRDFGAEVFHKQQLLTKVMRSRPDWIIWIDGDTILCRRWTEKCRDILANCDRMGMDGVYLHNLNLWRHPAYYRLDMAFDGLWHMVAWKASGRLHYTPRMGLHQQQFPHGILCPGRAPYEEPLIHYGFASHKAIVNKYLMYKAHGQRGHNLDRLIDEQTSFVLQKVPREWYPEENVPSDYDQAPLPAPLTYDEFREFASIDDMLASGRCLSTTGEYLTV